MAYTRTLPLIAGLTVFGAAAGVWLGRSAIAEINPAYYASAPERFHADQVPYRSPEWAQVQAAEFQQTGSFEGLGTGCLGCGAGDTVYAAPTVVTYGEGWTEGAIAEAQPLQAPAAPAAPDPDVERVLRYASYAVSSEEAAAAASAQAPAEPEVYASAELGTD